MAYDNKVGGCDFCLKVVLAIPVFAIASISIMALHDMLIEEPTKDDRPAIIKLVAPSVFENEK